MVDARCGSSCSSCSYKEAYHCGGCIASKGRPFHGVCPLALCCQSKDLTHCGECTELPCATFYAYSYLDPEHGDNPPGKRVSICRRHAAEQGIHTWSNVLLTSAGWGREKDGSTAPVIRKAFLHMLKQSVSNTRVLFITTAAVNDIAKSMVVKCREELLDVGIRLINITEHDLCKPIPADEAMGYDVIYFTGGDTAFLLRRIKETGFAIVIKQMVYANKVYIGVSAGSLIATPNISNPRDEATSGLTLLNAYLTVHEPPGAPVRTDQPLTHIPLSDNQAVIATWDGYKIITG